MALLAAAFGILGGLAGGLLFAALDGTSDGAEDGASAGLEATSVPALASASAVPAIAAPADPASLERAVAAVFPAIVTVIADAPVVQQPDGTVRQSRSIGSGIVISEAGHVLTNFHVVDGADTLSVVLATGELRPAQLLGDDAPFSDLAVLLVPPEGLRRATLAQDANPRPGEPVAAVAGGSITSGNTVATGVVAAVGRSWPRNGVLLEDLIQTDAAINQGDSGAALVNLEGEVIGLITTVVRQAPNGSIIEGVAFAQSIRSLLPAIDEIITDGASFRSRIGIERPDQHVEVTPELAADRGLSVSAGALVTAVAPGSPAAAAGIEAGDVAIALDGTPVDFQRPFANLLKAVAPGTTIELTLSRGEQELRVTLATTLTIDE